MSNAAGFADPDATLALMAPFFVPDRNALTPVAAQTISC